jgi:hypothetical protein
MQVRNPSGRKRACDGDAGKPEVGDAGPWEPEGAWTGLVKKILKDLGIEN